MLQNLETAKARERRMVRDRMDQMQRAMAAVALAVDGLPHRDRLIVLNVTLRQALDERDARQAIRA